jgi:hypothetical protein
MLFATGMILGGLAAWLVIKLYETSWEDIFPHR